MAVTGLFIAGSCFASCAKQEKVTEPAPPPPPPNRAIPKLVIVDEEVELKEEPPAKPAINYHPGESYQGMWNYDRRNFSIKMKVTSVEPDNRTISVELTSPDVDSAPKVYRGTVGDDGRKFTITGIAGTGTKLERVDGYHINDLLDRDGTVVLTFDDCGGRQLRGTAENGSNLYFWSRPVRETE